MMPAPMTAAAAPAYSTSTAPTPAASGAASSPAAQKGNVLDSFFATSGPSRGAAPASGQKLRKKSFNMMDFDAPGGGAAQSGPSVHGRQQQWNMFDMGQGSSSVNAKTFASDEVCNFFMAACFFLV